MKARPYLALLALLLATAGALTLWAPALRREVSGQIGLTQTFYGGQDFQDPPTFRRRAAGIELDFLDLEPQLPREFFSIRWEGLWDLRRGGRIDLYARADDRVRIYVDDALVLERSAAEGMRSAVRTLDLAAGLHRLKIEFVQLTGPARLAVVWGPAGEEPAPFSSRTLFAYEPRPSLLAASRRVDLVETVLGPAWIAFGAWLLLGVLTVLVRAWLRRPAYTSAATSALLVSAVTLSALIARLAGWNPESLWADDLVWAAITRAQDFGTMLSVPAHAPPGFFALIWATRALFRDPEWSLQILPFASGIAAIPVMAILVRRLTRSDGLALLAAALTALNPLLSHYTVYVKQYSFDFLVTAILLLTGLRLVSTSQWKAGRYVAYAVGSGATIFFSVTSAFTSFPIVNLAALLAWFERRSERSRIVAAAAAYNVALLLAAILMRSRANETIRAGFSDGFISLTSIGNVLEFFATQGRRLLETSLPSWRVTEIWNPETVSWPLPFIALGLAWLLVRRETRAIALVVVGFSGAFLAASALRVYPLGADRTDIFAFPVGILLFVVGVAVVTEWAAWREGLRAAIGVAAALYALWLPVRAEYWAVNDSRMVGEVVDRATDSDGLILSPTGSFLAAHYGPWPVVISATTERGNGTDAQVVRPRTLHLPPREPPGPAIDRFLNEAEPRTLWYVGFRTGDNADVVATLQNHGYAVTEIDETSVGRLYLATSQRALGP